MAPEVLYRVIYGSSKVPPERASLAANLKIRPALLSDYCRHRVLHCDYPGIIPEKGHTVRGTYVKGLTDADIWRLDVFEGDEYERRKIEVALLETEGEEDKEVEADTYVFTAGDDRLEKVEWDYDVFRREKMHRWADHSDEYKGRPPLRWRSDSVFALMKIADIEKRLMLPLKAMYSTMALVGEECILTCWSSFTAMAHHRLIRTRKK